MKITTMLAIMGTYENGVIKLDEEPKGASFSKVVVTFLEEKEEIQSEDLPRRLRLEDFHFAQSREALKNIKGSLSDASIDERISYL